MSVILLKLLHMRSK